MTPEELFGYADRFARRSEEAEKGTKYPTFRQVAKRFKVTYDEIETVIDDYQGDGYLGMAVGMQVGGMGGGTYRFESRGQYLVEAYT